MKKISVIIILITIIAVACSAVPDEATMIEQTPSPEIPTTTPAPTSSPTFTPTPIPLIPLITYTPLPIEQANFNYPSPDGNWTASCIGDAIPQLTVHNKSGSVQWIIYKGVLPDYYFGYSVIQWSSDSRYLFYNEYYQIDGPGGFYDGAGLYQLDVESGISKEIIPARKGIWEKNFPIISIAPDETFLVYIMYEDDENVYFTIYDIANETREQFLLEEYGGSFLWADDQSFVLFSSCDIQGWESKICSIKKFDFSTNEFATILLPTPQMLYIESWIDSQNILLMHPIEEYYQLNLQSGEMTPLPDFTPEPE